MSNITGRLIKGSIWLSLSRAIVNGLATLSTFVLARYLAPSDFGVVALGTSVLMIITGVTELSLVEALIHHEAPKDWHLSAAWTLNALRGLVLCLFLAGCAYPAAALYDDPRLAGVMVALGVSVFLGGLANPRLAMLQRELIFWQEFVLSVFKKLAGFTAAVAIAVIYHSYWALVVGTLVDQATNVLASYLVLPFRPRITLRSARDFLSFSGWLAAGQVVSTLNWRFDNLLIGKVLGGSALGYYTVGSRLATLPTRESTLPLTQTIFPSLASIRDDPRRLAAAYQRVQSLVVAIALPAGIGVASIADPLVRLALGEKWQPAVFIVQALASIYALQTLGSLARSLGMAKGETRLLFIRDTQMLFIRFPVILGALLLYGMEGLIVGRVLTGLVSALLNMFLVRRFVGITILGQLSANARALASVAVMAACVSFLADFIPRQTGAYALASEVAVLVSVGALLYCGSTLLLWILMKRPAGPETEILSIMGKILTKVRPA